MNGPQHYAEAERLIDLDGLGAGDDPRDPVITAAAQVHATLALVAAIANHQSGESSTSLAEVPRAHRTYDGPTWSEVLR